jgi:Flp pilus assembly pilin Flp
MAAPASTRAHRPLRLVGDERGTVFAEYVTLLTVISIGAVAATIALGVPLTKLFLFQRAILLLPIP